MKRLINWLKIIDNNLLKILLIAFIFIAPLYPKLPLKMVTYTYVAIRLEDIYLTVFYLIFIIWLLRKKITLTRPFAFIFMIFWIVVTISYLFNFYISKIIPVANIGFLHSLRRVEYMTVFLIAGAVVKSKKDFWQLTTAFLISLSLVVLYGFGQKFFNFPAVQTMNDEYAKGYILFLTPEARISSTFGGHYDLAAYLVFSISILLGLYLGLGKKIFLYLFILALTILLYTASRTSFLAYFINVVIFLIFFKKFKLLLFVVFITALLMFFTGEMTKRFLKTFQLRYVFVNDKTGQIYIGQQITVKELPAGSLYLKTLSQVNINKKDISAQDLQAIKNQILDQEIKKASQSGKHLSKEEQDRLLATSLARLKATKTVLPDISFSNRLQVEWPRAIKAFLKNPILGTGPSSLTEATDNDYLRWLGETGLLGTSLFILILITILFKIYKSAIKIKNNQKFIFFGLIFAIGGLLINSSYIDVFEASKVAYTFWTVTGFFVGYLNLKNLAYEKR